MKIIPLVLFLFIVIGCSSTPKVKEVDLNSWIGTEESVLDSHDFFTPLKREVKLRKNPQEVAINFYHKSLVETKGRNCIGAGMGTGGLGLGSLFCSPSESIERVCVHQFIVKDEIIKSYKVLGKNCSTSCEQRPLGCDKKK